MNAADTSSYSFGGDPSAGKRWGGSFAAVLALHVGVAAVVATWAVPLEAPEAPPPAVLIDMLPTPPAPPKAAEVKPEEKPKELPVVEKAEVVIRKPKPKPKVEKRKEPQVVKTLDTRPEPAAPQRAATASSARPAPSPNYLSVLYERLERYRRYPRTARSRRLEGTVNLSFTIDRSGHVLSASVAKSSGIQAFDDEVLAMARRADPFPPPPADRPGETLSFTIPISFSLRN